MTDFKKCPQCLETIESPTTLPCGHNFCSDKCLLICKNSDSTCPVCREPLTSDAVHITVVIQQAIDAMNQTSTTTQLEPEPELCPNCEDADATLFCKDCDVSFCQDCSSEVHQMKVFQSHHPVPISLRSELSLPRCPHHKGKTLSYFCTKCKVALCDSCNSDRSENNSHSLHQDCLIPFTKAREIFTKQANELQTGLTTVSVPLVEYGGKVLNLVKETIEGNQSIMCDLIGDLIWQSQSKIQQIDSCNVIEESINFDENVKVKAEESISRAIDSLQKFKTILNTCLNDLESKSSCFQINLLREILGKEIIDVNALNISKRAQLVLFMVQVDPEYLPSIEQLKEFLPLFIDEELKKKLVLNFVNNSKLISTNDLVFLFNLDSSPFGSPLFSSNEFESAHPKIEFNTLDEDQFVSLINYSIKYSNSWLLGKAIDHYEFNSLPDIFTISTDLLLNLSLSNLINNNKTNIWSENDIPPSCSPFTPAMDSEGKVQSISAMDQYRHLSIDEVRFNDYKLINYSVNKNKEEWLEKVIVKNCSVDTIGQLCLQLLGRESKYNSNQIESIKTNPFGALPFVSSESKSFFSFSNPFQLSVSPFGTTSSSDNKESVSSFAGFGVTAPSTNDKKADAPAFGTTSSSDNKESVSSFAGFGVTAPSTNDKKADAPAFGTTSSSDNKESVSSFPGFGVTTPSTNDKKAHAPAFGTTSSTDNKESVSSFAGLGVTAPSTNDKKADAPAFGTTSSSDNKESVSSFAGFGVTAPSTNDKKADAPAFGTTSSSDNEESVSSFAGFGVTAPSTNDKKADAPAFGTTSSTDNKESVSSFAGFGVTAPSTNDKKADAPAFGTTSSTDNEESVSSFAGFGVTAPSTNDKKADAPAFGTTSSTDNEESVSSFAGFGVTAPSTNDKKADAPAFGTTSSTDNKESVSSFAGFGVTAPSTNDKKADAPAFGTTSSTDNEESVSSFAGFGVTAPSTNDKKADAPAFGTTSSSDNEESFSQFDFRRSFEEGSLDSASETTDHPTRHTE
ncbi:hypothetical protein P9112_010429 [Eukaryota sp. TZLM1-RC]